MNLKNVPKETWGIIATAVVGFLVQEVIPGFVPAEYQSILTSAVNLISTVVMLLLGIRVAVQSVSVRVNSKIMDLEARVTDYQRSIRAMSAKK